ncbi:hypothetical protein [Deinococcus saxicola]|uniref:hypothetical protein n=1 Tax=Deinococcus saxicola TaxID=249406 RepID=UPI0039F11267
MKVYAPDEGFIDALLCRPQMYLIGNKSEGIINLMFGIRAAAEHYAPDDLAVQRWMAFEVWMYQRHGNQTGLGEMWTVFRQHLNDDAAANALYDAYAEYRVSLSH